MVGFVVVHADEVEQIYVDASVRGTGVAATLLGHGEAVIGRRFDRAWLAVVEGNARARRFYERNGWSDGGAFDYPAHTAAGTTIVVPSHRYEKSLSGGTAGSTCRRVAEGFGDGPSCATSPHGWTPCCAPIRDVSECSFYG